MNNEEWDLIIRDYCTDEYNEISYAYEIYKYGNKYKVVTGYDITGSISYEFNYLSFRKDDESVFVTTKVFDSFIDLYESILEGDYCIVEINGVSININDMMNYTQVVDLFRVSVDKDLHETIKDNLTKSKIKADNPYDLLDNENGDKQSEFEEKIRNGEDTTVDDLTKLSDLTPAQLKRNGIYEVK